MEIERICIGILEQVPFLGDFNATLSPDLSHIFVLIKFQGYNGRRGQVNSL